MSIKKFMDLSVGDRFKVGGTLYEKIEDERINCCRVNNAIEIIEDPTISPNKTQIIPITEVEIDD